MNERKARAHVRGCIPMFTVSALRIYSLCNVYLQIFSTDSEYRTPRLRDVW